MIRLIVILAATLGAFFGCVILSKFGDLASIAFTVGGFGITYVMLGCVGVGYAAIKVTK